MKVRRTVRGMSSTVPLDRLVVLRVGSLIAMQTTFGGGALAGGSFGCHLACDSSLTILFSKELLRGGGVRHKCGAFEGVTEPRP
jgi:hypothetical protein